MQRSIDEPEVRRIARLARLQITDEECREFCGQLDSILKYFSQIQTVQVDDSITDPHLPVPSSSLRPDLPRPGLSTDDALRNAPQRHQDFFRVPAVLGDESGA
ncbi:MAG: Asp-tRNA(Asn)/Glu-tRNA(Gln) amidotransferase subunit GatC [Planctomycetes bacterium]|nr:Asp-tRNA(Asn)/Glu-tRNA(Gln) amidotransferase subunit GatC [Planctomycetota bacterium]